MSMRIKARNYKTRSTVSQRLDGIQDQCRKSTNQSEFVVSSYKPLLLQSYERYTSKKKVYRQRSAFGSQTFNKSEQLMSKSCTSRAQSYAKTISIGKSNKIVKNCKSINSTDNIHHIQKPFFPTQIIQFQSRSRVNTNKIQYRRSTQVYNDPWSKFLSEIYSSKVIDLKISMNARQKQMFIERLKPHINRQEITIIQSELGYRSVTTISNYLLKNKNLFNIKRLNLDKNCLGDKGVTKLAASLHSCESLSQLSLVSVNISNEGANNLICAIKGHPHLKLLNISSNDGKNRNRLGLSSMEKLKEVFQYQNCKLSTISLANTGIGTEGFLLLCEGLKGYHNEIIQLNLAGNQIKIRQQNQEKLRSKLKNVRIKKLHLQNNSFGDIGARLVAYLLGITYGVSDISKTMHYIDLSSNQIKSRGLEFLSMSLAQNHKLTELCLSYNNLSEGQNFYTIRYLLIHNWSITKISLRKSISQMSCLNFLAQGLSKNRTLYYLDISENKFDCVSFQNLFQSLAQNKLLRILKMDNCGITDEFIDKIYPFFKQNHCLQSVSLNNNYINAKGGKNLLRLIMQNKRICELYLKKNCINSHILNQIYFQLKENTSAVMSCGDPDLKYMQNARKVQNSHQQNLLKIIEGLQKKGEQLRKQNLIHDIGQKQNESTLILSEITIEKIRIKNLQKKMRMLRGQADIQAEQQQKINNTQNQRRQTQYKIKQPKHEEFLQ